MTGSLSGRTIVVCRPVDQSAALIAELEERGAAVVAFPVIEVVAPLDGGEALAAAARRRADYDWVTFTSANGALAFGGAVGQEAWPERPRIAAVGEATAKAVRSAGGRVDFVPTVATAAELASQLPIDPTSGDRPSRVLAPLAELAGPDLMMGLADRGAEVEVVTAYRTVTPDHPDHARADVAEADAVVITSPSTIDRLVGLVGPEGVPETIVAIGPVSAEAVRRHELTVAVVAQPHSEAGLIDAVVRTLGR